MWRKIVLAAGVIAVLVSILKPVTRTEWINPPQHLIDGSIVFEKETKQVVKTDYGATTNRTLCILIGAAAVYLMVPDKKK
jgi:hypothetical protein